MEDYNRFCADLFDHKYLRASTDYSGGHNGESKQNATKNDPLKSHMIDLSYMEADDKS